MKTLCFSLGLLLLVACCSCDLHAVRYSVEPASCCFNFATRPVPKHRVTGITKTHASCHTKAFVVKTNNGKICYKQSFPWANEIYAMFQNTEGSGFKA
ncbi:uncharacterized protein V6R79_019982 [Siganus canaliculatus]